MSSSKECTFALGPVPIYKLIECTGRNDGFALTMPDGTEKQFFAQTYNSVDDVVLIVPKCTGANSLVRPAYCDVSKGAENTTLTDCQFP